MRWKSRRKQPVDEPVVSSSEAQFCPEWLVWGPSCWLLPTVLIAECWCRSAVTLCWVLSALLNHRALTTQLTKWWLPRSYTSYTLNYVFNLPYLLGRRTVNYKLFTYYIRENIFFRPRYLNSFLVVKVFLHSFLYRKCQK